jgi:hypothetical protein
VLHVSLCRQSFCFPNIQDLCGAVVHGGSEGSGQLGARGAIQINEGGVPVVSYKLAG